MYFNTINYADLQNFFSALLAIATGLLTGEHNFASGLHRYDDEEAQAHLS